MQMTINFNKLFNYQDSTSNTPSTTSIENSYHIDESSIISTRSNNINIHYKFNEGFFFDSSQDHEQNLNILEDLSSIGRSSEDDLEGELQIPPVYSRKQQLNFPKNTNNNKNYQQKQSKLQHTFYLNEKDTSKAPGERLYYESKIKNQRKLKQLERIKMELQQQQKKEVTFKPTLNEKSKKILQFAESPFRKLQNMKKNEKNQKSRKQGLGELKSTAQKKQQEQLRNCTFKPTILKTPRGIISTPQGRSSSSKDYVFESLYNQHRAKIERQRKLLQEQQKQRKGKSTMLGKQQLQQFFSRNAQYIQQKKHREQLLKLVSSQYDLTSGRKLFQPKINGGGQGSLSMARFNCAQGHHQQNNSSSKTPKADRQLALNSPKGDNVKTHFRSNSSNLMKSKDQQTKMIAQKRSINRDVKGQYFKAKAYQVSKFTDQVPQSYDQYNCEYDHDDPHDDGHCQQQHSRYTPKSGIFNKTSSCVREQLFQTNQQQAEEQQLKDQQQSLQHDDNDEDNKMKSSQQLLINQDYYDYHQQQQIQQYNCQGDIDNIDNDEAHIAGNQSTEREEDKQEEQYSYGQNTEIKETGMSQQTVQGESNRISSQLHQITDDQDAHISAHELQYAPRDLKQNDLNQHPLQYQQRQTPKRKPSQDNDYTINRSTFLESIVKNPIYSHKYNDLFALQSNQPQDYQTLNNLHSQQSPSTGTKQKLFKPLFLAKDSEQQEIQQKLPNKSWQEIFTASTKIDKTQTVPPSQSGFTEMSKVSQIKPNSSLPHEESPKKKPINIASLLKAKKKQVPKQ